MAAAQEARFTRRAHETAFPAHAARYCLREAGLSVRDLDHVAVSGTPLPTFKRLIDTALSRAPAGFSSVHRALSPWLRRDRRLSTRMRRELGPGPRGALAFIDHDESHAAAAFLPSPFDEAAILTLDGVRERTATTMGVGRGRRIDLIRHLPFPHSLGLVYAACAHYCGFAATGGEDDFMGLAPYGRPVYADLILKRLLDLRDDGSFWLDMAYFSRGPGITLPGPKFAALFGGPPRAPQSAIEQRYLDLAASIQAVTETVMLALARDLARRTGQKKLVLAGRAALNGAANGRLLREGPFDDMWIQPAGDAGGALGAALFVWHQRLEQPRPPRAHDRQHGSCLGPAFSSAEIRACLDRAGAHYAQVTDEPDLIRRVVDLLAGGKIVGWFQGRMEFGPMALGARSILADARSPTMPAAIPRTIAGRDSGQPCPSMVLREEASNWFGIDERHESPYMLLDAPVLDAHRVRVSDGARGGMRTEPGLPAPVQIARSTIPAVTHVDGSARLQTVDAGRHPRTTTLLRAFGDRTGCPVLVNASFHAPGEPIVCTPEEAYRCFRATGMDALVMEDVIVLKAGVPAERGEAEQAMYRDAFPLS